jgi:hypothetical protein
VHFELVPFKETPSLLSSQQLRISYPYLLSDLLTQFTLLPNYLEFVMLHGRPCLHLHSICSHYFLARREFIQVWKTRLEAALVERVGLYYFFLLLLKLYP